MKKIRQFVLRLINPEAEDLATELRFVIMSTGSYKKKIEAYKIFKEDFFLHLEKESEAASEKSQFINEFLKNI